MSYTQYDSRHQNKTIAEEPDVAQTSKRPHSNISDQVYLSDPPKDQNLLAFDDVSGQLLIPNFFKKPFQTFPSGLPFSSAMRGNEEETAVIRPAQQKLQAGKITPNVTISLMHRSQSAAADLSHCRPIPMPLTKEMVHRHTLEQEQAYIKTWSRRKSVGMENHNTVTPKRTFESAMSPENPTYNPSKLHKLETPAYCRPASLPVMQTLSQQHLREETALYSIAYEDLPSSRMESWSASLTKPTDAMALNILQEGQFRNAQSFYDKLNFPGFIIPVNPQLDIREPSRNPVNAIGIRNYCTVIGMDFYQIL